MRMPSRAILVAGLFGALATASGIALTATSGWLIVRASEQPVILTLLTAIVAVRAFGMARPFFRYVERLRSHDAALSDLAARRTHVFAGLIPLTPARLGRRSRASLLTGVVDDLTDEVEAQVRVTVPVLSGLGAGLAATVLTAVLCPSVGLVLAGLLVAVTALCLLAHRLESAAQDELGAARAEVQRVSDLVARNTLELQAIGAAPDAQRWLTVAHRRLAAAVRSQSRGRALVAAGVLVATGLAATSAAALAHPAEVGAPVAALLVLVPVAIGDALAPLTDAMRALARAQGSARRLEALLAQDPAVQDRPGLDDEPRPTARPVPELNADRVAASWTGERADLRPTDVDLPPGRHLAVVGANGSGKSTLLAVLARHLDPVQGRYAVDGTSVRDLPVAVVRREIALVDDETHVFAATLRDNLRLAAPEADDDDLREALRLGGLQPWFDHLESGLDTRLGEGERGVSGGERARIGMARAHASRRPVVLLDEPVAALDHPTATSVLAEMLAATDGRSVVLVTHRPVGLADVDETIDLTPPVRAGTRES